MILGIGVDVVELARIEALAEKYEGFAPRIFTEREIDHCFTPACNAASAAGRFAVKEAVSKALGTGLGRVATRDIETVNDAAGAPEVHLYGEAQALAEEKGVKKIHCSISHERSVAVAMIILEG